MMDLATVHPDIYFFLLNIVAVTRVPTFQPYFNLSSTYPLAT